MHDTMLSSMSGLSLLADSAIYRFPLFAGTTTLVMKGGSQRPSGGRQLGQDNGRVSGTRPTSSGLQHKWPSKPPDRAPPFCLSAAFYPHWEKEEEPEPRFFPYN